MPAHVLTYQADGLTMQSHLYGAAAGAPKPAVLVFPEAFGLGQHAKSRAERLADLGYLALACDLHGNGQVFDSLEQVMGLIAPLRESPHHIRARARGGLDALLARPDVDATRIAAIGYCIGGTMALELARGGAPIVGAAGFHSGLATTAPADARNIRGRILVCIGADDPAIDRSQRDAFEQEMRAGQVDWQMNLYGGTVHSFTNPEADSLGRPEFARYNPAVDARSWAELQIFLTDIFAPR